MGLHMNSKYVNLRWKIGGILVSEIGPVFVGGRTEYVFNIDCDHLSIPELIDIAKDFGVTKFGKTYIRSSKGGKLVELTKDKDLLDIALLLNNGDTVDIYVCNDSNFEDVGSTVKHVNGGDENGNQQATIDVSSSHVRESFDESTNRKSSTFCIPCDPLPSIISSSNSEFTERVAERVEENRTEELEVQENRKKRLITEENTAATIEVEAASDVEISKSDSISEKETDSGEETDLSIDYGSDVHEEVRVVKQDLKTYKKQNRRKKKKEKVNGFLGEVGLDEGFEDIDKEKKNLKDKLGGDDEPYYGSSDPESFASESDIDVVSDDEVDVGDSLGPLRARRKSKRVTYDPSCEKVIWECGMVFENVKAFREAVTKYAINKGVELDKYVNESRRVRVRCQAGCPWLLMASKEGRSSNFTIKTYNPRHKCHKTNVNFLCNSNFLAKHYKDRIISQPGIKAWEIQDLVRNELGVHVGKAICLKTRKIVLKEVMGDHIIEFNRILDYRDVLLHTNPGSTCVVKVTDLEDGKKEFVSFYICFAAMKKGFLEGCRRCIGLDGCFLKGISKGQLLVAIAKDGNNQMFPIAWAVVSIEKKATWLWFLRILQQDIELGDGTELTIISDMQKGLESAVKELLPECEHRMCARHILSNWSKHWKGIERRNFFWSIARATFEAEMKDRLDELDKLGNKIVESLIVYNTERWCKTQFRTFSKCDSIDNNMAESFNAWILGPRHKTIVSMLEEIRIKMMTRVIKIRSFVETWVDGISPMAMMVFNTNVEKSMKIKLYWNADTAYEVVDGLYHHVVDLQAGICSCRSWELKGIPCAHAIAAMHNKKIDASTAIAHWYRKETYLKAYSSFIQPVPNMKMWPASANPIINPPPVRKMPGRPRRNRRKEIGEVKRCGKLSKRGIAMTCSICKSSTHNKRRCPLKDKATTESTSNTKKRETTSDTGSINKEIQGSYKRPRVVGQGVFVSQTGYTCVNPGMPSVHTSTTVKSSTYVTGDIGYKPSKGLKWKGNEAVTQRQLQNESATKRIQMRSKLGKTPSKDT